MAMEFEAAQEGHRADGTATGRFFLQSRNAALWLAPPREAWEELASLRQPRLCIPIHQDRMSPGPTPTLSVRPMSSARIYPPCKGVSASRDRVPGPFPRPHLHLHACEGYFGSLRGPGTACRSPRLLSLILRGHLLVVNLEVYANFARAVTTTLGANPSFTSTAPSASRMFSCRISPPFLDNDPRGQPKLYLYCALSLPHVFMSHFSFKSSSGHRKYRFHSIVSRKYIASHHLALRSFQVHQRATRTFSTRSQGVAAAFSTRGARNVFQATFALELMRRAGSTASRTQRGSTSACRDPDGGQRCRRCVQFASSRTARAETTHYSKQGLRLRLVLLYDNQQAGAQHVASALPTADSSGRPRTQYQCEKYAHGREHSNRDKFAAASSSPSIPPRTDPDQRQQQGPRRLHTHDISEQLAHLLLTYIYLLTLCTPGSTSCQPLGSTSCQPLGSTFMSASGLDFHVSPGQTFMSANCLCFVWTLFSGW
ncbi:hypothetical protein C8R43DRAFT_963563 [Mycena crocata]|nr:hypothetical protein C8R43DRAFT_963563 [Mycena crocata]